MKTYHLGLILSLALLASSFGISIPGKLVSVYNALEMRGADANDPLLSRAPTSPAVKKMKNDADIAHGVLMGIAVVLVLPLGALITRFPGSRSVHVRIHVFCQIFGVILLLAGFGLGVWTCIIHTEVYTDPHTTLGTVITAFFLIQPTIGYFHHRRFAEQKVRSWWTQAHIWFGRCILIMAICNGGYGILYAENSPNGQIGYGVMAGVVGVLYIGFVVLWYLRASQKEKLQEPEMHVGNGADGKKHEQIIMESAMK